MGVKVKERPPGSGVWWVFINHNGKRKAKKVGALEKAEEVAEKTRAALVLGDLGFMKKEEKKPAPTFGEYAKGWIGITVPATCKPSTARDYRGILKNHVLPAFGKKKVTEIDKQMVRQFLMRKIRDGAAMSTVTHIKNVVSGVLNEAVYAKTIPSNPAHRIGKLGRSQTMAPTVDPLTREELDKLLKTFKEHFAATHPLALTLARTGMRLGEALGLQWGDIDFNSRFIWIRRSYSKGSFETPKNGKDRRVDMSQQLADTLQRLRTNRKKEALRKWKGEVPEWVFPHENGIVPIYGDVWRREVFVKALEKAGLRKIRIHDLRHTYASLLIQSGESLAYIRDQLGHHSIKVTVDVYGHLAPEGNKAAVDALDDPAFNETIRNLSATRNEKGVNLEG